ncbi:unnamed protein product [Effrenium voratum]|uniref:Kringle domain-containing protein n=1 Tax=Effrenium voratum TaxID=2562239 RepID=A0AA36J651_9DINO|nr:unnamed protein product [Effrenium voratum]
MWPRGPMANVCSSFASAHPKGVRSVGQGEGEPQSTDVGGVQVLQDNTWGGYDYGYGHWGQIGCEDRGLLSIRSKTICKLAFQALGVGTTFQGHEDAKLLGGGHIYPDVPNQPKGCFISVYWSDYEFDYHYNPINETEVSRVEGNFDYAYKSVCLVPPLSNECNATECEEDTVMSGEQCTPVCPPGQVPTHKSLFCVEGNLSPPAYSCVPEREPEGSECEDLENSTFDCLNVTVRGTACQRWDFDSPFNIAERNNSERPPHNFCRRSTLTWRRFPMKATGPDRSWCFTTADGMSWDYCMPQCVEGPWRDRDTVIDPTQQALAWTCRDYTAKQLCTEEGYGAKWGSYITRTGTFDDYRYLGLSAREACCACGGGKRSEQCEDNPLFEDQFGKCGIRGIHKGGCNHVARFYCPRACGLCKVPEPAADKLLQTCEDFELDFRSCLFYTSSSDTAEDVCSDMTLERRFRDHLGDEAPASFGNAFEKFRSVCPFSCRLCHKCKPGFLLNTQPIANASDRLAYQCVACQPGQFSPSPDGIRCLDCEPGRSAAMPGRSKCETCRPGYSSSSGASLCDPCSAGFIPNLMRTRCDACPSGSFAASNASNSCELCPEGSFAPAVGSSECSLCSPGRYSAQGSSRCVECPAGFAAPKVGAQACDWCQKDTYTSAAGSSSCLRCGLGTITVDRGTTSVGDCVCPAGTCFDPEQQYCTPCLEGMVCDVGCNYSSFNDAAGVFPRLLPGYMTRLSEPLRVFRCRAELHCPGGEPASCAAGRDSAQVACGLCALGFSPSGQNCNPCQDAGRMAICFGLCWWAAGGHLRHPLLEQGPSAAQQLQHHGGNPGGHDG